MISYVIWKAKLVYITQFLVAGQQMPPPLKLKSMTFVDPDVRRGQSGENPPYDFKWVQGLGVPLFFCILIFDSV